LARNESIRRWLRASMRWSHPTNRFSHRSR
jgi:hypothetical protein